MITHGKAGKYITTSPYTKIEVRGYYLVLQNKDRHWIGLSVYDAARDLEKVASKHLSDINAWDYWIDYCSGYDVHGKLIWANNDKTEDVQAAAERLGW